MPLSRARTLVLGGVVTIGLIGIGGATASALTSDVCGRNEAKTAVFAELDLPNGAAIWQHFPSFGKAPELLTQQGPIHVIAFSGTHQGVPVLGGPPPPGVQPNSGPAGFNNVVCVVYPSGEQSYYANIQFGDFRP
jgi:hypothetical protein